MALSRIHRHIYFSGFQTPSAQPILDLNNSQDSETQGLKGSNRKSMGHQRRHVYLNISILRATRRPTRPIRCLYGCALFCSIIYAIGVDLGGCPGTCPPIIEKRLCIYHFLPPFAPQYLVCPPNIFDKSTP